MSISYLFINYKNPDSLNDEQIYAYIEQYKSGDLNARNIIVEHNIALVKYIVDRRFMKTQHDSNDLIAVGLLALLEKLHIFDTSRNVEFVKWAGIVVFNGISSYVRKNQKHFIASIDEFVTDNVLEKTDVVCEDYLDFIEQEQLEARVTLADSYCEEYLDFIEFYDDEKVDEQVLNLVYNYIDKLPIRDKQIIILYYGLFGNRPHSQTEVGKKVGVSHTTVGIVIYRFLHIVRVKINSSQITGVSLQKR